MTSEVDRLEVLTAEQLTMYVHQREMPPRPYLVNKPIPTFAIAFATASAHQGVSLRPFGEAGSSGPV